jgi:hypothetical protein
MLSDHIGVFRATMITLAMMVAGGGVLLRAIEHVAPGSR